MLAEGIEVTAAALDNGLLHVDLVRPQPMERRRSIEVRPAGSRAEALPTGVGDAKTRS